jgi:membrane associated rhomboid family serine protease
MALFNSIWDDFKYSLRAGNMVTKLVVVNFAVFVVLKLIWLILGGFTLGHPQGLYYRLLDFLWIPADLNKLMWRFWTVGTHMFLHDEFWHLFNNLIGLYLFGTIVGDLVGDRRILPLYLICGFVGGAVFVLTAQFASLGMYALGASAAVMGFGGAALILAPEYRVPLLLLGSVKVKYIVLVLVLLDLASVAGRMGTGGPAAHLAGFVMGCFFVYRLRDGKDMTEPLNTLIDRIRMLFTGQKRPKQPVFKPKRGGAQSKPHNVSDKHDLSHQEKLDAILDKIKANGYDSLTQEEKAFLFEASKK